MATTINANNTDGVVITPDTSGELELQANGVTKAKVTANGLQDANGASLRGGSYRNLIINGNMQIAQRGTSSAGITGDGYHTVDRFYTVLTTGGTWTQSQDTDAPSGFGSSLKMSCTTANASLSANSRLYITTKLEGQNLQHPKFGTSSAEKITLSFWVKSNKTGTYVINYYNADNVKSNGKTYTINSANTWEKKTITVDGDIASGFDNDNNYSLAVYFWMLAGTDWTSGTFDNGTWNSYVKANFCSSSQVNLADSTSNYINITGVQLEVGEGASDFEHLPYDVQLQRCQRYFQTITTGIGVVGAGMAYSTTSAYYVVDFMTPMRAGPVADMTGDFRYYRGGSSALTSTFALSNTTLYKTRLSITGSGLRTGEGSWLQTDGGPLAMDAEL